MQTSQKISLLLTSLMLSQALCSAVAKKSSNLAFNRTITTTQATLMTAQTTWVSATASGVTAANATSIYTANNAYLSALNAYNAALTIALASYSTALNCQSSKTTICTQAIQKATAVINLLKVNPTVIKQITTLQNQAQQAGSSYPLVQQYYIAQAIAILNNLNAELTLHAAQVVFQTANEFFNKQMLVSNNKPTATQNKIFVTAQTTFNNAKLAYQATINTAQAQYQKTYNSLLTQGLLAQLKASEAAEAKAAAAKAKAALVAADAANVITATNFANGSCNNTDSIYWNSKVMLQECLNLCNQADPACQNACLPCGD